MKIIKNPIIPKRQVFAKAKKPHTPNYEAICVFAAIGFFLDQDTFWKDEFVLKPATTFHFDDNDLVLKSKKNFNWYHEPRDISFKAAVDEFTDLFESLIKRQSRDTAVIFPLSGGLDSRTQAVALNQIEAQVQSYSYGFTNGFKEHKIGEQIARICDFKFDSFLIPKGYLWDVIAEMAEINGCYSDFIHPRQMAVIDSLKKMQGQFSLGHWGDVLFDRGVALKDENQPELDIIYKKLIKKGGLDLASKLWSLWDLDGDFETYLKDRIKTLLDEIDIIHKGAKVRAFKSLYWAPRWTSVSLRFFEAAHPIQLPYYEDEMCRFICEIPEEFLADRKIQIQYIKNRNPNLAKVQWQDHKPFNLYNYKENKFPRNLPYRIANKFKRETKALLGEKYIQRNWELQFLGAANDENLKRHLYSPDFKSFLKEDIIDNTYRKFKNDDAVFYSHGVSMLLTLSQWFEREKEHLV